MDGIVTLLTIPAQSGTGGSWTWNIVTPSGEVIGRHPVGGSPRYYYKDHLGSVRAVVDHTGAIREVRGY